MENKDFVEAVIEHYESKILLDQPLFLFQMYRYFKLNIENLAFDEQKSILNSLKQELKQKGVVSNFFSVEFALEYIFKRYQKSILEHFDQEFFLCLSCLKLKTKEEFFHPKKCTFCHFSSGKKKDKRKDIQKLLPRDFDKRSKEWKKILRYFHHHCALSDSEDIIMEHFIPVSIGHGGTVAGNVYPLDKTLNLSKGNKNPFEWVKEQKIDTFRWQHLIEFLASENGLSIPEFTEYTYWCFENSRTEQELLLKPERSLVLFLQEIDLDFI